LPCIIAYDKISYDYFFFRLWVTPHRGFSGSGAAGEARGFAFSGYIFLDIRPFLIYDGSCSKTSVSGTGSVPKKRLCIGDKPVIF
jgi:hypothetical protein